MTGGWSPRRGAGVPGLLLLVLLLAACAAAAPAAPAPAAPPAAAQPGLPEVLDEAAWTDHELAWCDGSEPYTCLMFQGAVQPIVWYNTTLASPADFNSYWDVTNPRWEGKIESTDIRPGIVGGVPS